MNIRAIVVTAAAVCFTLMHSVAQEQEESPKRDLGHLSGSVETSWGVYVKDKTNIAPSSQKWGENTYINIGYTIKGFRLGLQYDIYEKMPLLGFNSNLAGNGLGGAFAGWSDDKWDITLGSFYEQYGSGMIFRAYEERELGINTSIWGGNIHWRPLSWLSVGVMSGVPKRFVTWAKSCVAGADVELSLLEAVAPNSASTLTLGGSWVLRHDLTPEEDRPVIAVPRTVNSAGGRVAYGVGCFSFDCEYVWREKAYRLDPLFGLDNGKSQALLLHAGVDLPGFGVSATWRSIENMGWNQADTFEETVSLNYLPSLTKQHKYALMSLYPHETQVAGGETGGQIDIFGEIPLGGNRRRPLHIAFNASVYRRLERVGDHYKFMGFGGEVRFVETVLELEKRWTSDWKTTLAFSWQRQPNYSRFGLGAMEMNTEIVVADVLWQVSGRSSLRAEVQHAWSDSKDDKAWVMGLLEYGFAPRWMVYVSDMVNYRTYGEPVHYYDAGLSYSHGFLRAAASWGRHRAGQVCAGGVCRYVPEHTGLSVSLTMIF